MTFQKKMIDTQRRTIAYIREGDPSKPKFVLVHGNSSGSAFYTPTIKRLMNDFDVIAPDLNGFGKTEASPIHAPTAIKDWSDDLDSLFEALGIDKFILLGWSLGGGVVMRYAIDHPEKLEKLLLISPMSPFGFGGTHGVEGTMNDADGSGSPGGFANPEFVKALALKDRSDNPNGPRAVIYKTLVKPDFKLDKELEDLFVDEMLEMRVGEDYYPGNFRQTTAFPFVLPGEKGISNSLAPQYCDVSAIADIPVKPEIVWFRGDSDILVSDSSLADLAVLGKLGVVPMYPGEDAFPPQPMVSQTRYVFEKYKANGGVYTEYVLENAAHTCQVEQEDKFIELVKKHCI